MAAVALAPDATVVPSRARCGLLVAALVGAIGLADRASAASTLVLSKNRVEVSITWRSQYSGETGSGIAIPVSDVFGFFAFTDPKNPEVFVKVLDFGSSSPLLLFYGGLTDFEYHLTFHNRCSGQDVKLDKAPGSFDGGADNRSMLPGCETGPAVENREPFARSTSSADLPLEYAELQSRTERSPLATSPDLYLSKARVKVSLTWRSQYDGSTGTGIATPINDNFGFLSFFNQENPEVFVKVLDFGSASPLLLFYGGLTDFEYEVTFENICTNQRVVVRKPPGSYAGGGDNRSMLAVCAEPPLPPHLAAIKAVEERFQQILDSGVTPRESIRAIGAYMATIPEYTVTGVQEESYTAYGQLKNGRWHIVTNSFGADPVELPAAATAGRRAPLVGGLLPVSGRADVMTAFPGDADSYKVVSELEGILMAGGYTIPRTTASLGNLRAIKNSGFLYINAHAGWFYFSDVHGQGTGYYCVVSFTPATLANERDAENADDLKNDRIVYFTNQSRRDRLSGYINRAQTQYGVTWKFVEKYWAFSENAILHFTTCSLMAANSAASPFVQACLNKRAGVVFGWTDSAYPVSGFKAARYFVDRLLGANSTIGGITKESPEQRPFPWRMVYDDMVREGLTATQFPEPDKSNLVYKAASKEAVLDPAIQELVVNEPGAKLVLRGDFGSKPGRVWVGGDKREDCQWDPDRIECPLPLTGKFSKGNVYVDVEGEPGTWRESNIRQLQEWKIPLKYQWIFPDSPYRIEGDGELRYRADVAPYRKTPGDDPFYPLRGMVPTPDSYLLLVASGVASSPDCTGTLAGIGRFESPSKGPNLPYQLISAMQVETRSHIGSVALDFGATQSPFKITYTGPRCPPIPYTLLAPTFGEMDGQQTFASPDPTRPDTGPYFSRTIFFASGFQIPQDYGPAKDLPGLKFGWDQLVAPDPPFDPTLER